MKQRTHALGSVIHPASAEVITSALRQHGRELTRNHAVEKGKVFGKQLLLQTNRVRRNNNSLGIRFLLPFTG